MLSLASLTVLAHQGGWDETLMVLTPIAVFALLLKLANGRAKRAAEGRAETPAEVSIDPAAPDDPVSPA